MASQLLETSVTCKLYEDLIAKCENQVSNITNRTLPTVKECQSGPPESNSYDDDKSTIHINSETLDKAKFQELATQITRCSDSAFIVALRNELQRQLNFHQEHRRILNSKVVRAGQRQMYFRTEFSDDTVKGNSTVITYYHFDGDNVAREIEMRKNQSPTLRTAGRDDSKMFQYKLQEAQEAMDVCEDMLVTEEEFNELWFEQGGLPYVRPSRLARRHLFSVLSKKV